MCISGLELDHSHGYETLEYKLIDLKFHCFPV